MATHFGTLINNESSLSTSHKFDPRPINNLKTITTCLNLFLEWVCWSLCGRGLKLGWWFGFLIKFRGVQSRLNVEALMVLGMTPKCNSMYKKPWIILCKKPMSLSDILKTFGCDVRWWRPSGVTFFKIRSGVTFLKHKLLMNGGSQSIEISHT